MSSTLPAVSVPSAPPCFGDRFDPELGLWSHPDRGHQSSGALLSKLERVHSLPRNAARLVVAAQLGALEHEYLDAMLGAFRRLQCLDGSAKHGNFAWWAEEGRVTDTNAAFFVGLNLCVLRLRYADALTVAQRELIDTMMLDLDRWFDHAVAERAFHYPNRYLGDLVCSWLIKEILGKPASAPLDEAIRDAARYWLEQGWGWGEHLSDIYTGVMFWQLGALLVLARKLPDDLRGRCVDLFRGLLALEDGFAGGPRVPALRSYDFEQRGNPRPFLEAIRTWRGWGDTVRDPVNSLVHFAYGHLFAEAGVLKLRGEAGPPRADAVRVLDVPCLRGARAVAWVEPAYRIGSVSNFPIMPEAEYPHWGLSWQSFPVAFTAGARGWGFLRWRSREDGVEAGHPSITRNLEKALSRTAAPALIGWTDSRQRGPRVVALRRMPRVSLRWEFIADALELIGLEPKDVAVRELPGGGRVLTFSHEGQAWTCGHHPLVSGSTPEWVVHEKGPAWQVSWPQEMLKKWTRVAHLWWLAPGAQPDPTITLRPQKGPYLTGEEGDSLWSFHWPEADATSPALTLDFDLRRPLGAAFDQAPGAAATTTVG